MTVRSYNSGIQHRYGAAAATYWKTPVSAGEVAIAPHAFDAGQGARRRFQIPLERPVAIERAHGRQVRDRRDPALGRSHSDHWQSPIARAAQDSNGLQICNVCVGGQVAINDYGVDVAGVGTAFQ